MDRQGRRTNQYLVRTAKEYNRSFTLARGSSVTSNSCLFPFFFFSAGKKSSKKFKEPIHEWAQGDMEEFKDEDFDFQANLGLFDKARVFAEIRVRLESTLFSYRFFIGEGE